MQVSSKFTPLNSIFATFALLGGCDTSQAPHQISVAIISGGDTALDGELQDEVARMIDETPLFAATANTTAADFIIEFERNVRPLEAGPHGLVAYEVTFRSAGGADIGKLSGQCSKQELRLCAKQVVEKAKELPPMTRQQ